MSRLKEIAKQAINGIIPLSNEELAVERMKVCEECEHFSTMRRCGLCGCFMDFKVKMLHSECPKDLW